MICRRQAYWTRAAAMTLRWLSCVATATLPLALTACRTEDVAVPLDWSLNRMIEQPRYDTYARNDFFEDHRAMRPPPPGTQRYHQPRYDPAQTQGKDQDGTFIQTLPFQVTEALVDIGQARYRRTCAMCHGVLGDGNTIPAEHMRAVPPPNLHTDYMRDMPDGQLFATITEGFGMMPSYSSQLDERERWAVVAYVRALQLSQHAQVDTLPPELREALTEGSP